MDSLIRSLLFPVRRALGGAPGFRPIYRHLPSEGRCKECWAPFEGIFAIPFRLVQIVRSRKNPNLCTM